MCTDVASMGLNTPGLVLGVSLGMSVHSLISRQVTDTEKSTLYSPQQGDGSICMNSDTILKRFTCLSNPVQPYH